MRGVLEADLSTALKDARAGLSAWRDAVRGLGDNPLYRRLKRAWGSRGPRHTGGRIAAWAPPVVLLTVIGYLVVRFHFDERLFTYFDPLLLGLLLLAGTVYVTWVGMGLHQICFDALALLARSSVRRGTDLRLDETVMGARLSDREFLTAILASLLPRLWLRWLSVPIVSVAGLWLYYAWQDRYEAVTDPTIFGHHRVTAEWLSELASWSPLTMAWLLIGAVPVSVVLLLWLIALGRSIQTRWQMQLVATSLSVAQLAWIPLSVMQSLRWATYSGWEDHAELNDQLSTLFLPLLVLVLLIASLHFTRAVPGGRAFIAAAAPALSLAIVMAAIIVSQSGLVWRAGFAWYILLNNAVWAGSCFALLNLHLLPHPALLGASHGLEYYSFRLPRALGIILLVFVALAICSHAARLAVADWRKGEA